MAADRTFHYKGLRVDVWAKSFRWTGLPFTVFLGRAPVDDEIRRMIDTAQKRAFTHRRSLRERFLIWWYGVLPADNNPPVLKRGKVNRGRPAGMRRPPPPPASRPYPKLLTEEESKALLEMSERLLRDLLSNDLGGFSGVNRPFWIMHEFKQAIEQFGGRDVGLKWSKQDLDRAKEN